MRPSDSSRPVRARRRELSTEPRSAGSTADQQRRRFATIRDVASDARVGTTTVSRALNNSGYVADDVRQRVLESVERLGYRPSARARSMRNQRSMTIGVVLPELLNPVYLDFLRGVEDVAQRNGYVAIISSSHQDADRETAILDRMVSERVAGIVIGRMGLGPGTARRITDQGIAVVPIPGAASTRHDRTRLANESEATAAMARQLLDYGHRAFMIVSFAPGARPTLPPTRRSRVDVLKTMLSAAGAQLRHATVPRDLPLPESAAAIAGAIRTEAVAPTAVIAATHLIAPDLLLALKTLGLTVPDDVSVVTYGDSPWAIAHNPSLSVIRHETYLEAVQLTEMLLDHIGRGSTRKRVDYRAEYVERESIGPARVRNRIADNRRKA